MCPILFLFFVCFIRYADNSLHNYDKIKSVASSIYGDGGDDSNSKAKNKNKKKREEKNSKGEGDGHGEETRAGVGGAPPLEWVAIMYDAIEAKMALSVMKKVSNTWD